MGVKSTRPQGTADDATWPAGGLTETGPSGTPAGDSFEAFVRARSDVLFRTAFVLTGRRAAAEDLVQETLARVLLVWRRVAARGEPDAYVYRVMVNTHRRTGWKVLARERPTARLPDRPGPDAFARTESLDQLSRVLARLPARQRCAVVLRHYLQFSEAETAAAMGCRIGTVKSLTSRGLAQLRVAVDDQRPSPRPSPRPPAPEGPASRPTPPHPRTQRNDSHG